VLALLRLLTWVAWAMLQLWRQHWARGLRPPSVRSQAGAVWFPLGGAQCEGFVSLRPVRVVVYFELSQRVGPNQCQTVGLSSCIASSGQPGPVASVVVSALAAVAA